MEYVEQVTKNLKLSSVFIGSILEKPDTLRMVPAGASVVFETPHDPLLNESNKKLAEKLREAGQVVTLVTVEEL